jgi:hypothetical protein
MISACQRSSEGRCIDSFSTSTSANCRGHVGGVPLVHVGDNVGDEASCRAEVKIVGRDAAGRRHGRSDAKVVCFCIGQKVAVEKGQRAILDLGIRRIKQTTISSGASSHRERRYSLSPESGDE